MAFSITKNEVPVAVWAGRPALGIVAESATFGNVTSCYATIGNVSRYPSCYLRRYLQYQASYY